MDIVMLGGVLFTIYRITNQAEFSTKVIFGGNNITVHHRLSSVGCDDKRDGDVD